MNSERESSIHERFSGEPLDFASIRNPLGPSPETAWVGREEREPPGALISDLSAHWGMPENSIMLGQGSDPIISRIPKLLLPVNSKAVLPVPTYFGLVEAIPERLIVRVSLSAASGFEFTMEAHRETIDAIVRTRPGLVWLCSPNNPTGTTIRQWQISEIAEAAGSGIVVIDEAYQEIADPGNTDSAMHLIAGHPNILVTRTFSKAYGLPDIRVGVAVGDPGIIGILSDAVAEPHPHSIAVARAALRDQGHILQTHQLIQNEIEFVMDAIAGMGSIIPGSVSRSGVMIIRHEFGNLHKLLAARGIKTTDFNNQAGLEGLGFVRLGILDRIRNTRLINALWAVDKQPYFTEGGIG